MFNHLLTVFLLTIGQASGSDWAPTGAAAPGLSVDCHPQLWQWRYLKAYPEDRPGLLQDYLRNCGPALAENHLQGHLAEELSQSLRGERWPLIAIQFTDRFGRNLTGWLARQEGEKKRPAVLIACEENCDPLQNDWLKSVLIHLYDEGPFDVLILDSPEAHSLTRGVWLSGGYDYGRDLLEAGFWLATASPYRTKISSYHVFGQGWGSQGVLNALLYNDQNPIADDRKVFHSGVALCPSVSLGRTLASLDQPQNDAQKELSEIVRARLRQLQVSHPKWADWLGDWTPDKDLSGPWINASLAQIQDGSSPLLRPIGSNPPANTQDWLEANDFLYTGLGLNTPSWVVGTSGDPRFPADDHWRPLASQHKDPKKSRLRVAGLRDETTCRLGASHGWAFERALWQSLLLQTAYEIWPRSQETEDFAWNLPSPELSPNEFHLDQEWQALTDGRIQLTYFIGTEDGPSSRTVTQFVDPSYFPKDFHLAAKDASGLIRLTRQLNAWLRLTGKQSPLLRSRESATHLLIWRWR